MSDPGFRSRLLRNLALAMILSGVLAVAIYGLQRVFSFSDGTSSHSRHAVTTALNACAVVFWPVFAVLFFGRVYKTRGVLEYERLLQRAWDRYHSTPINP